VTILHTNGKASREIDWAIDEIAAGNVKQGLGRLCRLRGKPMPEIRVRKMTKAERVAKTTKTAGRAKPKPDPRLKAPDVLARYRLMPCAVAGEDCWHVLSDRMAGCPSDPHHLIRRSAGGPDTDENLIALCRGHHTGNLGWHTLRPWPWYRRFRDRLSAEDYAKVERVLNLAAEEHAHG
jgi:hypothetical protein